MPKFSLIVPVYNVEGFIRECLDSVLAQDFDDYEVIVVDDLSTDASRRIVRRYTKKDPRIKLVKAKKNAGAGIARNIGIGVAAGEYLMFLDGDDSLAPGALSAIDERLAATGADLLIYDYVRTYWDGRTTRSQLKRLFAEAGTGAFSLESRPEVLDLFTVAWNKVCRRSLVESLRLRFPPGYYEDVPWTYGLLLGAKSITMLPHVCYHYRQRRHGNALRTKSRAHAAIFDQYARVFSFLDAHPELEQWRPILYRRMLEHYLAIFRMSARRVPPTMRGQFFNRMRDDVRRYAPRAGTAPPVPDRKSKDAWGEMMLKHAPYLAFEAMWRWRRLLRELRRRRARLSKRLSNRFSRRMRRRRAKAVRTLYRVIFTRLPLDPHLAVFAAYWHRGYRCNPRAIYEKMIEMDDTMRGVWVVTKNRAAALPPGVEYVTLNSLRYYWTLARATYLINNVNFSSDIVKRRRTVHLQTHHGTPLKTMGVGLKKYPVAARGMNFRKLLRRVDRWDFSLSSNTHSTEMWHKFYPGRFETLEYGYPRNDLFFNATPEQRQRIRMELGIHGDRKAILYAPTYRDLDMSSMDPNIDLVRFAETIGPDYVVLVRAHYFYGRVPALAELEAAGAIVNVTGYPDVQELCLAADILITDYSSIQFDFANLNRPIVLYVPDYNLYERLRGFTFDVRAEAPGAVAETEDQLLEIFSTGAYDTGATRSLLARYRRKFCKFEDGHAAERVVRRVFFGEAVKRTTPLSRSEGPKGTAAQQAIDATVASVSSVVTTLGDESSADVHD